MLMQEFVNNVAIITTSFIIIVFSSFISENNEAPRQSKGLKIEEIKLKHELNPNRPAEPPTEIRIGGSYIKNQDKNNTNLEEIPNTKLLDHFKSTKNPDLAYHAVELDYTKLEIKKQVQAHAQIQDIKSFEQIDESDYWFKDEDANRLKEKCQAAEKASESLLRALKSQKKYQARIQNQD